ncbi:MAG: hypothetical protein PHI64_20500 [Zoogloea sp.]|uniref:BrnT family toxin n=1 Tax=Zoogloea sp. TaxID=49181 RepID=UPI002624A9E9|nr:hypothetical protein [Zoogloea sp.]MDD2991325.1 hypothetical protein [Zoogloea sp.]
MEIEFDPIKSIANQAKHGVSLAPGSELDWDAALVWIDERYGYDEVRMIALAPRPTPCTTWRLWIVVKRAGSSASAMPLAAR